MKKTIKKSTKKAVKKSTAKKTLTPRQKRFADHYIKTDNASESYRLISPNVTDKTASVEGCKYLAKPNIKQYIQERLSIIAKKDDISVERLLAEEKRLAFLDPRSIFDKQGCAIPPHELPEDVARALSGIDCIEKCNPVTGEVVSRTYKYRFWDKGRAMERMERHLNMFEKDNKKELDLNVIIQTGVPDPEEKGEK